MGPSVIAMPRGMGRPLALLVLSAAARAFLEGQVRRHRVARDGSGDRAVAHRAPVLCVDAKSQIQARDPPSGKGVPRRPQGDVPDGPDIHKTRAVKARRPHRHIPFTPISVAQPRGMPVRRTDPQPDISAFIYNHNENPKPFKSTRADDNILAALKPFCRRGNQNSGDQL
ncbi:MAG: hypothetical protein OXC93_02735 [Rhodospirillaceae bacterium]|nr:hypothetical protein [Rhodospirillaceae bacterium]